MYVGQDIVITMIISSSAIWLVRKFSIIDMSELCIKNKTLNGVPKYQLKFLNRFLSKKPISIIIITIYIHVYMLSMMFIDIGQGTQNPKAGP